MVNSGTLAVAKRGGLSVFRRVMEAALGRLRAGMWPVVQTAVAAMTAGLTVNALGFESGEFHDIGTPEGVVRTRAKLETASDILAGQPA